MEHTCYPSLGFGRPEQNPTTKGHRSGKWNRDFVATNSVFVVLVIDRQAPRSLRFGGITTPTGFTVIVWHLAFVYSQLL